MEKIEQVIYQAVSIKITIPVKIHTCIYILSICFTFRILTFLGSSPSDRKQYFSSLSIHRKNNIRFILKYYEDRNEGVLKSNPEFHFLTLSTNALWWPYEEVPLYVACNNNQIHKILSKINSKGNTTHIPHVKSQCFRLYTPNYLDS